MQQSPEIYWSDNYVTLDFETDTSHGDYGHPVWPDNGMILASWKVGPGGKVQSHFGDEFNQGKLLRDVEAADFLVCHNAKYELGWLKRCGLDLHQPTVFDTKIAEYVLLGNLAAGCNTTGLPPRSTSLDMCCRRRGWKPKDPVVDKMMKNGINPIEIPKPWLQGRCEQDVRDTERLFRDQRRLLADTDRLKVQFTRCLLTPVLADIEFEGMYLDAERVEKEYNSHVKRLRGLERKMDVLARGINWRSPKQVADFLYAPGPDGLGFDECRRMDGTPDRTAAGRKKADQHTIAKLKATNKEQKEFLAVRQEIGKVSAALSKSLQFFDGICSEHGNLLYATFNQTRTATHRLSSTGHYTKFKKYDKPKTVQFQNLPRAFKPLFQARRDDWVMMEIDGSQLEFRVAADLGKDKQAMQDISDPDFDAHCLTASVINNEDYDAFLQAYRGGDKAAKRKRTAAKLHTFKPLYGGESGTKSEKAYYKTFKERYSALAKTQDSWLETVLNTKKLVTPWGMRYYWPRAKRGHDGYANVKSSVYNYPVQALATAEIIPIALRSLWELLRDEEQVRIVNTVHDSVILEVHPDAVAKVREAGIQSFGQAVYDYLSNIYEYEFHVPLGCGITVGPHWSEGDEESYNIWPNGKVERVE